MLLFDGNREMKLSAWLMGAVFKSSTEENNFVISLDVFISGFGCLGNIFKYSCHGDNETDFILRFIFFIRKGGNR